MLHEIKADAKRAVKGIEFQLFMAVSMLIIFSIAPPFFIIFGFSYIFMMQIFAYKHLLTGERKFSMVYEDFNDTDNFKVVVKAGLLFLLYQLIPVVVLGGGVAIGIIFAIIFSRVNNIIAGIVFVIFLLAGIAGFLTAHIILKYRYWFVPYILKDTDYSLTTRQSFEIARRITKKKRNDCFKFELSFIWHYLLTIITIFIYGIWFLPYKNAATVILYTKMRDEYLANNDDDYTALLLGDIKSEDMGGDRSVNDVLTSIIANQEMQNNSMSEELADNVITDDEFLDNINIDK